MNKIKIRIFVAINMTVQNNEYYTYTRKRF